MDLRVGETDFAGGIIGDVQWGIQGGLLNADCGLLIWEGELRIAYRVLRARGDIFRSMEGCAEKVSVGFSLAGNCVLVR